MNDASCLDIVSFLFQPLKRRFRHIQVFVMHEVCQFDDDNCSCSDNGIIFANKHQDNTKQGVIKRYVELRFITIAYFLFFDVLEVLMLELLCGIALLTYLFVTWS